MTEARNSAWIPAIFTALYAGSAYYVVQGILIDDAANAANPSRWVYFGEPLARFAVIHVPLTIFLLWVLYGTVWVGKPRQNLGWLVLISFLCPFATAAILGLFWPMMAKFAFQ